MPTVTRSALWFYDVDVPYVEFEVKGLLICFHFTKTLTYCIPEGRKKALWPGGPAAAREDGIDLTVPEWSFWLIADDSVEMSCCLSDRFGPRFAVYSMDKGIDITLNVTVSEAKQIKNAVEAMVEIASGHDEEFPRDESLRVLKPSNKVIAYPVKAYRWTSPLERTATRTLQWNPTIEGY